jgi:hypothetical protein
LGTGTVTGWQHTLVVNIRIINQISNKPGFKQEVSGAQGSENNNTTLTNHSCFRDLFRPKV